MSVLKGLFEFSEQITIVQKTETGDVRLRISLKGGRMGESGGAQTNRQANFKSQLI